jgi:serine/threonine protein kinase/Tol biopolymer transport system component
MAPQDALPTLDYESGRYRFERRIGTGGMGVVYRALDTALNRPVAIKTIRDRDTLTDRAVARLRAEALAAASLDHPYICKIYEFIEADRETFIVMEFVDGETLDVKLRDGPLPIAETLRIGREIAEGLGNAHDRGLVHRDVKPSNVMVPSHGHVKLLDFGLARIDAISRPDVSTRRVLASTGVSGTPSHMAPEQIQGRPATARMDVFALGVVLFQCVTGELPFAGKTTAEYLGAVESQEPKSMLALAPAAPPALAGLVSRCLTKDPAARPASGGAIAEELRLIEQGSATGATDRAVSIRRSGHWVVAAAAALLVLTVLGALMVRARMTDRPDVVQHERTIVTWSSDESESRVSPDGRWVAFVSTHEGPRRLFLQATAGGEPRRFDGCTGEVMSDVWSSDNQRIACISKIDGRVVVQTAPVFASGVPSQGVAIDPAPGELHALRWIGASIFVELADRIPESLIRVDMHDSRIADVTGTWSAPEPFRGFDVSPDGQRVVYSAISEATGAAHEDLWVADLDGGHRERLTSDPFVKRAPRWVGSGRMILYESNRNGRFGLWEISSRSHESWALPVEGAPPQPESSSADGAFVSFQQAAEAANLWRFESNGRSAPLTEGADQEAAPSVSRDSRTIVFERLRVDSSGGSRFTDKRLFYGAFDGSTLRVDPSGLADGISARVSPDGSQVAYIEAQPAAGQWRLRLRNLATAETITLTEHGPSVSFFLTPFDWVDQNVAWTPDGRSLFFIETVLDHGLEKSRALLRFRVGIGPDPAPLAAVDGVASIRDVYPSPDGRRVAYLSDVHGQVSLHIEDLEPNRDHVAALWDKSGQTRTFLAGWTSGGDAVVVLQGRLTGPFPVDAFEVGDGTGQLRLGSLAQGVLSSARLNTDRGEIDAACLDGATFNLCALSLATGKTRVLTDNRSPAVSYSGIAPLRAGALAAVRDERKQDVWLVTLKR